jgi:hypothetical protein
MSDKLKEYLNKAKRSRKRPLLVSYVFQLYDGTTGVDSVVLHLPHPRNRIFFAMVEEEVRTVAVREFEAHGIPWAKVANIRILSFTEAKGLDDEGHLLNIKSV